VDRVPSLSAVKLDEALLHELQVHPGSPADLRRRSTESTVTAWSGSDNKALAKEALETFVTELAQAQRLFWANGTHALLIVLQAMDAAGKDGTIRHVMSGVNPQGCKVESFKQPSATELAHDFLWRSNTALPELGMIGIFNRSYYEDVLIVRVHPELLARGGSAQSAPPPKHLWANRYDDINAFERHLDRAGTRIVKIFLHVSRDVQRRRLLDRLDTPDKNWKFSASDVAERAYWDEYVTAYEEALTATSTPWAPWYVVPADHKYALRALVGGIVVNSIDDLDLRPPVPLPAELAALESARQHLMEG
jgi:PPK2 family polyphosphate:nucleotide phosphotransferase